MLSTAAYYVAYAWIVYKTILRVLSVGDLTMYLAVVRQCQGMFESLFTSLSGLYEHALFLGKLHEFLAMEPRVRQSPDARPVPRPFAQGIEFRAPLKTSHRLTEACAIVRTEAAFWDRDRAFAPDLAAMRRRVEAGDFLSFVGPLFDVD